jgi:phosphatidylglycerophosphate synthase
MPRRGSATELVTQLRAAGLGEPAVAAGDDLPAQLRAVAALARASTEPLLLCGADVVAQTAALVTVATEPGGSVALVGAAQDPAAGYPGVRESRGLVASAGAAADSSATGTFLGVLRVAVADLPALADFAERLADQRPTRDGGTAADLLLPALVDSGHRVGALRLRLLVADRAPDDAAAAAVRARMAAVDEDEARLRLAVKERDDFFTTYFVSPISPYVVRWAAGVGLSPTAVTGLSVGLAVIAALGFAWGSRTGLVAGAVLLYVSFVFDCVDGQLARYTRQFSAFGGWLDTMADRSKEYLVYAGLAVGAERTGLGEAWPLAVAAIALQTVRHMTDTWYGALHDEAAARHPEAAAGGVLGRASEKVQADTGSLAYWLKRIVVFPIGERWALIAATAALFNGRVTLIAVLVWGGLAMAYTLALRSLRALSMKVPVMTTVDLARHRDDGPLVRALARVVPGAGRLPALPMAALAAATASGMIFWGTPGAAIAFGGAVALLAGLPAHAAHAGALDWLVPAALRAAEYLFVAGVGTACGVPLPLVFVLLFALALRHYDLTARMEKRAAEAPTRRWDPGWDGRVLILAAGAVAGAATATVVLIAGYVGVMFCVGVLGARAGVRTSVRTSAGSPVR